MADFIRTALTFLIANYFFNLFVVGLIFAVVAIARARHPSRARTIDKLLGWHIFWSIGAAYLVNFVFHVFFGQLAASVIGWADSPFQLEVGTASLGFSAVGFFAAWRGFEARIAAVMGPALFLWGAACGHVYQMVAAHDFAPGNAGLIFYCDIFLPVFGLALLFLARRDEKAPRFASSSRLTAPPSA